MDRKSAPTQFLRHERPGLDKAFYSVAELADLLPVPVDFFIARAVLGEVQLFAKLPDRANVFSVHAEAVDLGDPLVELSKFLRGASLPDRAAAAPLEMKSDGIQAFRLGSADCLHVSQNRPIRQCLFECGLKSEGAYWSLVGPRVRDFLSAKKALSDSGWRLACYPAGLEIAFSVTAGYSRPIGLDLTRDAIFTTRESVETFLDGIDANKYVSDLLVNGNVVVDKPAYFSRKLNYLIETAERYWGEFMLNVTAAGKDRKSMTSSKPTTTMSVELKKRAIDITSAKAYSHLLEPAFTKLCEGSKEREGLLKAASGFIVPMSVRASVDANEYSMYRTYITPELLALMAGARYFWGEVGTNVEAARTYPAREEIKRFFRHMGFKAGDTEYAATLIAPEGTVRGRHTHVKRRRSLMQDMR